uniref:Ryanodine receptor n=2 Tax=Parascaris TaxID=6254 RepID=A0A915B3X3_PARUN
MTDKEETNGGEQDDISFLRTGDIVAMNCLASSSREGVLGSERVCLCTEGFGNRMCLLENVSDRDLPPDIAMCMLYIDNALSMRALQEMMSSDSELKGTGSGGGHKTLLYGHAVQLKHVQSEMYLACLSSCSSNDKLAFDVGVQETNEGEACWWTIHPASKQRSEGEKVRVGDDVILVSVATERYLHMQHSKGFMVIASFHQTLWNITSVSSGSIRIRNMGALFGNDVLRFFHGNDEVLTIPENWSEHPQHNMVIYEGGAAVSQARSLWRIELIRMKWHGALVGWEQVFRVRHITSGRYLGVMENAVQLYHKDKADFDTTAFVMSQNKDPKKQMLDEKEEEGMGTATILYGETDAFIQHVKTQLWLSYQTSEVTKKGLGKVEEKKAVALKDGHMDDCFTFFMALEEESKSARVIRKCSSVLNRFLKGIGALQREGNRANDWTRVDLNEVLKLMEDLIDYFAQPNEADDFEAKQNRLRALRSRQDLFQEEGVLNMILDTIDKFSQMEALPDFAGLIGEDTQMIWEEISTYLYLLVAAMIKGNHYNCAQFAAAQRLDWLFGRLSNPQSAEGILDVLYCVLTESPEALNMINEGHIKSVISLLEKVGRDPKVLDVLSSLCEGNGMAVRSSQNTITQHLLPGKDLLLQTKMRDHVSSMVPNILVGVVEGSAQFRRWYFEAEVEHIEQMTNTTPYLRIGWANTVGYKPFPGSGDGWGCNGVGDDFYSYGFDGRSIFCAGKGRVIGNGPLQKGDIVGCLLDLTVPEIRFTVNGAPTCGHFKNFNIDGYFFPVMSLSAKVSCRFIFGRTQGRLRFGPPQSFSPLVEALSCELEISECLSFGDLPKNTYCGPSTLHYNMEPFVPTPVNISSVILPHFAMDIHEKLAENLHELWAMRKIELGWTYGETRDENQRQHPCLTSFDRLPTNEKNYNINLAVDTMKTIDALGYNMVTEKPPTRLRPVRLPQNYQQSNGYKPQPLDAREIVLGEEMMPLVDALAKNTHNVWAKEKIKRGWTFGLSEYVDSDQKRSPHLVPYELVDVRIKDANRESAIEFIKALELFGIFLEPPVHEHDEGAEKELKATREFSRTYRAEATYAVTSGKWYFEFEVLTAGFMKVGWMDIGSPPDTELGLDDRSYGFDGHLVRKWHQGAESYGREWKIGDIVGSFLDLNDRTIAFSLNGELLLDPSGTEMAFDNVIVGDGFVPAMTLGPGQKARLNFGQDSNTLKYFTTSGLQEGYEPFCVNMYRQMPLWYGKRLSLFEDIGPNSTVEVSRIPATGNSPPSLKIMQKMDNSEASSQEKAKMEYIRLSLPVRCSKVFKGKDKEAVMRAIHDVQAKHSPTRMLIKAAAIPKEFEENKEPPRKSLGKSLLSAFKHSDDDDTTLLGKSKQTSFEDASHDPITENPAIRPASLMDITSEDRTATIDKIKEANSKSLQQKKTGLMARFREGHQKKKSAESTPVESKRTAETHTPMLQNVGAKASTSLDASSLEAENTAPSSGSRDPLGHDMPLSGPGRQSFLKKASLKKKKKKESTALPASPASLLIENRRPSILALEASGTVEGCVPEDDVQAMTELADRIDEFYYGVRIFPGQDPASVWVGWVTPKYHFHAPDFNASEAVRRCRFQEMDQYGNSIQSLEYRNCYVMNAAELLQSVPDAANTKVSGLLIGCIIDTSIGELSFLAAGQDTGIRFKLEPGAMLYPAAFVAPTASEILQFELGRIKYTFPLSSAMFKSSRKSLVPFCPPRLTVEKLQPFHWARVPNECLRTAALKLSDVRGWSVLCDDPVCIMSIYVPEKDMSYDILEIIEHPAYLAFHRQTLNLYCKLAAHGNQKVAHILCGHVSEDQLMYAVKNHYLSGPMRQGFHDFLIAVHLRTHVDARISGAHEYVIPLVKELQAKNVFNPNNENRFPQIYGESVSIRPVMACSEVQTNFGHDDDMNLLPPQFNFAALKTYVMSALKGATEHAVVNCRDLIGGNNLSHFEPLFKLFNCLLVVGLIEDDDLKYVMKLIHPSAFDESYEPGSMQKGLTEIELAEGVKIQLVNILDNICDIQLRHRIESLVAFAENFVGDLQQDQCARYMDIKQTDMPPAEAARRTKEFRCPPKEQMFRLIKCKAVADNSVGMMLDDDVEYDQCPMDETLQERLREFCSLLVSKVRCTQKETDENVEVIPFEEENSWVDNLAQLVIKVPPAPPEKDDTVDHMGTENYRRMIINMLKSWSTGSLIESNTLIRKMFNLLLRQYSGVAELMEAMSQTYVLHERNVNDVQNFIEYLMQLRELLNVQFESTEEAVLKRGLWQLMNNRIFFQHPDLMRLLKVHEDVMTIMMNILTAQQGTAEHAEHEGGEQTSASEPNKDASEMVVACSRFLCYFCRTSRQNQKAMFEHLSFLLDNATMLLARPSLRGSVPLDVAYSSFMDNNELALALKEEELDKVAVYLSRCGLQPNSELIAKGYPDLGWDPVEGERYIDFLRFCVWINGENVEENANLVIRLLIRRPECLGVALKGEGQGLFSAFKEAIALSEDIRALEEGDDAKVLTSGILGDNPHYPSKETEDEDYLDLGAATLDFYSSLVDLLAKCAPDPMTIQAGKGDSVRARAILRSLISLDDLGQILSLRFTIPNLAVTGPLDDTGPLPGLLPNHKQSVLLFLDRVYGIDSQEMLLHFLEQSFLPDLRAATMMDSPRALESDTALALNRYLCNAVLPLLTNHSHFFADAEHHAALLDATLHTVYRMNRLQSLTKNQRDAVSDFLVAITRELPPAMMVKLMRKVIIDIQEMTENVLVPLRIITLHYERCTKYYGSGNSYGVASEIEKRLSMLLFDAIFDSLGSKPYDPELFGKALPCLTAIGSAISPDYALTVAGEDAEMVKAKNDRGVWVPKPVDVTNFELNNELNAMTAKFAEHFHDSWSSRKLDKGWRHGDLYSRQNLTHPRLKPFSLLQDFEKTFYKERCGECLRALLAWNYQIELTDHDAAEKAANNHNASGTTIEDFNPRPVDLSTMTLEKDMMNTAERMAEHSHNIWAKKVFNDLAMKSSNMPTTLVPWDLLTDFERRKDRFRAAEILKFLQYHGYRVWSKRQSEPLMERVKTEGERSTVEKRFAYNLLEKLIQYLEQASVKMKTVKPSQELSRRNSFKKEGQDVKFFEKVVLPLMHAYFNAHRNYFLASSSIVQTGTASNKEKEMIANLFCRLACLLRIKNHAFGSVAKITVRCLQGLTQALDLRTLVKSNSDIVRTSLLTFFNNCADDLFIAVKELKEAGQYSLLRGQNLTSWISLEFAYQMIVPVLTTMFAHLAVNHFGTDLLVDEIQAACYKILDSAYLLTSLSTVATQRASIGYETDKHRPGLGQCLSAFAASFPVAFLEAHFNKHNKYSVLAKTMDQSVQVQEMLQNLAAHLPQLESLLTDIEQASINGTMYRDKPNVFDVDLPLMCSYLTYWWQFGPDGGSKSSQPTTDVRSEHMNRIFCALLRMMRDHLGMDNAPWLCRVNFAVQIIQHVTCDPVKDFLLPIAERLRRIAEKAYKDEEHMRTHPDDADEGTVAEDNARLVRDVYAFFPILMKYCDLHRAQWLKQPSWETDGIYENVAVIFKIWSLSQHFKREELNFMAQYEEGVLAAGSGEMKTGKAAIAERKKKRREGQVRKDKHANSIVIACLKRLLPVGLNVFGGRELDVVQQTKEKFLAKETEEKIREFIRSLLEIPVKTDPTDKNAWQLNLYRKIGKSQMRGKEEMTQEAIVEKIINMGQVVAILHVTEHPQGSLSNAWKRMISNQRKRAVVACFRMVPLYGIPRHRAINFFMPAFRKLWLQEEDTGQDKLIDELTTNEEEVEQTHIKFSDDDVLLTDEGREEKEQARPDPLSQLIQCFQRAATSEQSQTSSIANDTLYVCFARVMAKSVHIEEEDDEGDDDGELDQAQKEEISQALRAEQAVLADRGAAIMCLMYLSASNGEPSEMVAETLQLGIHLLSGGNIDIQKVLIEYLQLKKDVRFFTSLAGLMNKCSVLNLEMFERQIKAEGLGMGAELAAGDNQNLNDAEFTCSLFRFLQLTCEGHNLDFQNYLRTQPGHTTSVNLINSTVDYLLRLQESVMDFYWHYSSKEVIDEGGKEYFLRAIQVCSQVFNTLTESIQGPCVGNQMTLANSRLWDAINGFFFLFAHMMEKLYKNSTQLELLREFLNLQKDMIVLMLSMLEGNVLNGSIGKQMVDALVESQQCVEMILKFSDMFLKLKDLTTSQAFQDFDTNRDGWISPKEFQRAMESQKMYTVEEITYLMMCTDVNNDGKVDYMEFTERFHNPARDIGFNLAVLLTNLKEHITNDPRLEKIIEKASTLLDYFDPYLGRIEIMGSSKRVEKIYFEIQESWLEQWGKQQIRDSKNSFLFNVLQDDGGDQGKLEAFINFCEDTIFEMQHAAEISSGDAADSKVERAMKQRDYFLQQTSPTEQLSQTIKTGYSYGLTAASALRPANVSKSLKSVAAKIRSMTWAQLLFEILKLAFHGGCKLAITLYLIASTIFRFGYFLMTSNRDDEEMEQAALPMPENSASRFQQQHSTEFQSYRQHSSREYDIFGVHMHTEVDKPPPPPFANEDDHAASSPTSPSETIRIPLTTHQPQSLADAHSVGSAAAGGVALSQAGSDFGSTADFYEPKIAEQGSSRSRGSILNMLARNFKTIEQTTLYLAFFINVILLFHRVDITHNTASESDGEEAEEDEETAERIYITGMILPYISYEVTGWMLAQLLYWISVAHAVASFALLFSFYQLKIPLITFKRRRRWHDD